MKIGEWWKYDQGDLLIHIVEHEGKDFWKFQTYYLGGAKGMIKSGAGEFIVRYHTKISEKEAQELIDESG